MEERRDLKGEGEEQKVKCERDEDLVHKEQQMEAELTGRKPLAGIYWESRSKSRSRM